MENRSHALMAGLFTLILGAATLLALYMFGEKREITRELVVVTKQNVTGLSPQAQVRYRGIRVGKVLDIQLDEKDVSNILITIEVGQQVPLTRGTSAKLAYQGVTGIAHVLLEDDGLDPQPLQGDGDGLPRIAMRPSLLDNLEDALPSVLAETQKFLENANSVIDQENRQHLTQSLANLDAASKQMNVSLVQLNKLLSDDNLAGISAASREAAPMMVDIRQLVGQVKGLAGNMENVVGAASGGVGTLVPRVSEMTEELTTTSRKLNRVLDMLEDSPQSILFGPPPPQPGPGEQGFVPSVHP